MVTKKSSLYNMGIKVSDFLGNARQDEYKKVLKWFEGCEKVIDVASGSGTFLEAFKGNSIGLDFNPDNVEYCKKKGLNAIVGNALEIPFADNIFDGVFSSHLMQVFNPDQAVQFIKELGRVVKPGGVIVIVTLNWFERFFRHPENVRAHPPDAIRRYFGSRRGSASPMYKGLPPLKQEDIWLRRPALVEFYSSTNHNINAACGLINRLQHKLFLRKYWAYDAYAIKLRHCPEK